MGKLLEFLILVDVDIKLSQAVQNELSFIDENFRLFLKELFTVYFKKELPFFISSGMVALNMRTCLWWGVLTKMSWMSALILGFPKTLSHSSTTKNLH